MAFWGANDTQKNAQGRIGELGNWSYPNMGKWQNLSENFQQKGSDWTGQSADYWKNAMQTGPATVQQNRATGQEISPGVDQAIENRNNRRTQTIQDFQQLPGAQETYDKIGGNIDQYGGAIQNANQANQEKIGTTWKRGLDRNEAASADMMSGIGSDYGKFGDWTNEAYGGMRGLAGQTYGNLADTATGAYGGMKGENDTAYADVMKNLQALQPGGELQQAQVSRSYAPQMVSTMGRLRAAGADGLQGMEAIQGAERDRARGMDEAAAASTGEYVNAANNARMGQLDRSLGLGQNQLNTGLDLGQKGLNTELDLTREQNQNVIDLGREQRGLANQEIVRNLNTAQGLDTQNMNADVANNNANLANTSDYLNQRNANEQLKRAMEQQDWKTVADLTEMQNQDDLINLGLQDKQYEQGFSQNAAADASKNQAAAQLGQMGQQQTSNAVAAGNMQRGFANDALAQYLASYGLEAPNAGWGTKLLAGLGSNALNMFAPKMSGLISGLA